jgi:UDP-glucuronate 4-epimerase
LLENELIGEEMRILVTGAGGFIGSALVSGLLTDNEVYGLDSFSDYYSVDYKKFRIQELLPHNFNMISSSMQDPEEVLTILERVRPDIVVHLGAQAGVRLPIEMCYKYTQSNLIAFNNILTGVLSKNIGRFIYASSSSVYGNNADLPFVETETKLNPSSFYGATKLANELCTSALIKDSNTLAFGLRFFTVYGPWGRPDMAYFRMVANILSGSDFEFFGDGTVSRDFTFIDDAVTSIRKLCEGNFDLAKGSNVILNIGGGNPLSINKLKELIEFNLGKELNYSPRPKNKNDSTTTMANPEKLRDLIGYVPKTSLEVGIDRFINWAKSEKISKNLKAWVDSVK